MNYEFLKTHPFPRTFVIPNRCDDYIENPVFNSIIEWIHENNQLGEFRVYDGESAYISREISLTIYFIYEADHAEFVLNFM